MKESDFIFIWLWSGMCGIVGALGAAFLGAAPEFQLLIALVVFFGSMITYTLEALLMKEKLSPPKVKKVKP